MPKIRTFAQDDTSFVRYGSELAVPARFRFEIDEWRYGVKVDVEADKDGGPRITSLTVTQVEGGSAVTTEGLRSLPLAKLLRVGVELVSWAPLKDREGNVEALRDEAGTILIDDEGYIIPLGQAAASAKDVLRAERELSSKQRRWLLDDEHLAEVARVYAANPRNAAGRRAPTEAVKDHFGIPRSTAGRWVSAARKRYPEKFEKADLSGLTPPPKKARKR